MRPTRVPAGHLGGHGLVVEDGVERRGGDRADLDGVDPDARRQIGGGQLGPVRQRALGRAVGGVAPTGQATHGRRDVDHRSAVAGQHGGDGRLGQGVGGEDVEAEGPGHVPDAGVHERAGGGAPHVVDHDVDAPEGVDRGLGQAGHGVEVGQVGRDHDRPATQPLDGGGHLAQLLGAAGRHDDVGAHLGQGHGRGRPDAASGTGHDGRPAVEAEALGHARRADLGRARRADLSHVPRTSPPGSPASDDRRPVDPGHSYRHRRGRTKPRLATIRAPGHGDSYRFGHVRAIQALPRTAIVSPRAPKRRSGRSSR